MTELQIERAKKIKDLTRYMHRQLKLENVSADEVASLLSDPKDDVIQQLELVKLKAEARQDIRRNGTSAFSNNMMFSKMPWADKLMQSTFGGAYSAMKGTSFGAAKELGDQAIGFGALASRAALNVPDAFPAAGYIRQKAKQTIPEYTAKVRQWFDKEVLGLPDDPVERAIVEGQTGSMTTRTLGSIGGLLASLAVTRGSLGVNAATQSAKGSGLIAKGITNLLGKRPVLAGVAVEGARAVPPIAGGLIGSYMTPEGAGWEEHMLRTVAGIGGGALLSSGLMGGAYGLTPKIVAHMEHAGLSTASKFGTALLRAPDLTFGRTAVTAIEGAVYGTNRHAAEGADAVTALQAGFREGLAWAGGDVLFGRTMGLRKFTSAVTIMNDSAANHIRWLSTLGVRAGAGAAAGVAASQLAPDEVEPSALTLAIVGGAAMPLLLMGKYKTILGDKLFEKVIKEGLDGLNPAELGNVQRAVTKLSFNDMVQHLDEADTEILRRAFLVQGPTNERLVRLYTARGDVMREILHMEQSGVVSDNPELLKLAARKFSLDRRIVQEFKKFEAAVPDEQYGFEVLTGEIANRVGRNSIPASRSVMRMSPANVRAELEAALGPEEFRAAFGHRTPDVHSMHERNQAMDTALQVLRSRQADPLVKITKRVSTDVLEAVNQERVTRLTLDELNSFSNWRLTEEGVRTALLRTNGTLVQKNGLYVLTLPGVKPIRERYLPEAVRKARAALGDGQAVPLSHSFDNAFENSKLGHLLVEARRLVVEPARNLRDSVLKKMRPELPPNVGVSRAEEVAKIAKDRRIRSAAVADVRRVAGADARGTKAILPETVTTQGITKAGASFRELQEYAALHNVEVSHDVVKNQFVAKTAKGTIVGDSMSDLRNRLLDSVDQRDRALAQGFYEDAEKGGTRAIMSIFGMVPGAVVGSYAASVASDSDYSPLVGGFAGMVAGFALTMYVHGPHMNKAALSAIKLLEPLVEKPYTRAEAKVKMWTHLKPSQIARLPVDARVTYVMNRMNIASKTQNLSHDEKWNLVAKTMKDMAPFSIPLNDFDKIKMDLYKKAAQLGKTPQQAELVWRGFLKEVGTPFTHRLSTRDIQLAQLGEETVGGIGEGVSLEMLEAKIKTTQVTWGNRSIGSMFGKGAKDNSWIVDNQEHLTKDIKAILGELDDAEMLTGVGSWERALKTVAKTPKDTAMGFWQGLWPMRSIHNKVIDMQEQAAQMNAKLAGSGDNLLAKAKIIKQGYDTLEKLDGLMQQDKEIHHKEVKKLFDGLSRDERVLVGRMSNEVGLRDDMRTQYPELAHKADLWRTYLDEWADRLQLPFLKGVRPEEYLPWVYSATSLRQLRKMVAEGGFPQDQIIPIGENLPITKRLSHLLRRRNDDPLVDIIMDPLEISEVYVTGAVRKLHLDTAVATLDQTYWKALKKVEPHIAVEMGAWYKDALGLPRETERMVARWLDNIGLDMHNIADGFAGSAGDNLRLMADEYFHPGGLQRFVHWARGATFMWKLGGSINSSLVNLTQTVLNTTSDQGVGNVFLGGIVGGSRAGLAAASNSKVGKALKLKEFSQLPFIDPHAKGEALLKLARSNGIFSQTAKRSMKDHRELHELAELQSGRKATRTKGVARAVFGSAAIAGALGAGFGDKETAQAASITAGVAAGVTTILSKKARIAIHAASHKIVDNITMPFDAAERINRMVALGAAQRSGKIAMARASKLRGGAGRASVGQVAEDTALFAAAGAGVGAYNDEDNRLRGAAAGAVVAGVPGALLARKGENVTGRHLKDIDRARDAVRSLRGVRDSVRFQSPRVQRADFPMREALMKSGPITRKEVLDQYVTDVVNLTQFRMGRLSRGRHWRSPQGEVIGALQSFTYNQFEFVGHRMKAFTDSLTRGPESGIDIRVFRYAAYFTGLASAMSLYSGWDDADGSPMAYFADRIGLAIFPMTNWNASAEQWQFNMSTALGGPFVDTMVKATNTILTLLMDQKAREQWDVQYDDFLRQLLPALNQNWDHAKRLNESVLANKAEGLVDFMAAIANPAQTATGTTPKRRKNDTFGSMPSSSRGGREGREGRGGR